MLLWRRKEQTDELLVAVTDENGRTLGVEDPNDHRLEDDPTMAVKADLVVQAALLPSVLPKSLLPSRGVAYVDPRSYGGSLLNQSAGLGEPLNVIISARSSPELLTRRGLQGYLRSLDFDMECLGLHKGTAQKAFLDPRGWVDENFLYREVYTPLDYLFGTCVETFKGGNHLRAWQQQGTGAWFFAVSREEDLSKHHMIVPNGYNIGRDQLVEQSASRANGITSFMFTKYQTRVEYLSGLISPGAQGVNHGIATDGRVALLTVKLMSRDHKALMKARERAVLAITKTAAHQSPSSQPNPPPKANFVPSAATRLQHVKKAVQLSYSSTAS